MTWKDTELGKRIIKGYKKMNRVNWCKIPLNYPPDSLRFTAIGSDEELYHNNNLYELRTQKSEVDILFWIPQWKLDLYLKLNII